MFVFAESGNPKGGDAAPLTVGPFASLSFHGQQMAAAATLAQPCPSTPTQPPARRKTVPWGRPASLQRGFWAGNKLWALSSPSSAPVHGFLPQVLRDSARGPRRDGCRCPYSEDSSLQDTPRAPAVGDRHHAADSEMDSEPPAPDMDDRS